MVSYLGFLCLDGRFYVLSLEKHRQVARPSLNLHMHPAKPQIFHHHLVGTMESNYRPGPVDSDKMPLMLSTFSYAERQITIIRIGSVGRETFFRNVEIRH